jgi:RNA polymerase sigma-70 factor (ECF subfamily)
MKWFSRPVTAPAAGPFEALVRPHLEGLFRLAYRFTRSREDAEDLVQGLLVKLLAQPERLGEVEQLGPWLARSLYYFYVDHQRQRRRAEAGLGVRVADEAALAGVVDEQREGPEQAAERGQLGRRLEAALGRLSAEHRALIALHDVEGYKLEELAGMLELPIGTLKSRLHRGRAHLRWLLEAAEVTDRVTGVRVAL